MPPLLRQPRYVTASIACALGGLLLGIDTSSIGPVTIMQSFKNDLGELSFALQGLIVSMILLAAFISSFGAGRLADQLGRPLAIALGAGVLCIGTAMQAAAHHIAVFAVGRLIEGISYGLFFGTSTVYICEISPPKMRGPLTSLPQFLICAGLVVGYFTCYGSTRLPGTLAWRTPFILLTCLTALYILICLFLLPPSPRWLIAHGKQNEADKAWDILQVKHEDRRAVEQEIRLDAELETQEARAPSSFMDMFKADVRGRTWLAVFLMSFLQLCGIDAVLYYAPLLFQQAGLDSEEASFLASGISGIAIVVTSIPATLLADKWGRKLSVIVGGLGLSATMLIMATLYASNVVRAGSAAGYVVIVCIYLYCILDATTWAISIKVYAPEIQPQHTRAQATALTYGLNFLANWFVAFVAPIMLARSSSAAYFLFGGCTALATIVSVVYMVETRGKSLDEIEAAFKIASDRRKQAFRTVFSALIRRQGPAMV